MFVNLQRNINQDNAKKSIINIRRVGEKENTHGCKKTKK